MALRFLQKNSRSFNKLIEQKYVSAPVSRVLTQNFENGRVKSEVSRVPSSVTPLMVTCGLLQSAVLQPTPLLITAREYSKKSKHNREYDYDSDSDDEVDEYFKKQKRGERGNSDFWRRKMRTLHKVFDINNDGVISFDDFMLLAKKFSDLGHLPPGTYEEFMTVMRATWEATWGEITPYNLITAEQFLTDMHHVLNDKDLVKKVHKILPYLFEAVDTDHSGYLDLDQYKLFFRCLGLTEDDAVVAFAVMDENGDGQLTLKEFVKLGKDFLITEDERRVSKVFWGPLVNH